MLTACGEKWIEKPKNLIPQKKMVDMLADMHIANSMYLMKEYPNSDSLNFKSQDFYYSVLNKHEVTDTLFEKSLLYYMHYSKDYEKIYSKVLDKLSSMEQEYSIKEGQPVDIGNE